MRRRRLGTRLKALIPRAVKPALRAIYYLPLDAVDRVRYGSMVPPRSKVFVGGGDFEGVGREFLRYFVELGGVQPTDKILDVGCGIGRMALPLTGYLSTAGEYCGFDIVKHGIDWCTRRISPKFPNFRFTHSDVENTHYNPNGTIRARDYRFPHGDQAFDFAFATSVFTHMLAADLENYVGELSRVLKSGGRCLITFFLLNEDSRALIRAGRSTLDFKYERADGCLTTVEDDPEAAIAYEEKYISDCSNDSAWSLSVRFTTDGGAAEPCSRPTRTS